MAEFMNFAQEYINGLIEKKINGIDFDGVFKSKIVPKLEDSVQNGVENLFKTDHFQQKASEVFYADLFEIYNAALTDCAVVQKIIEENNANTNSAFTLFIKDIKNADNDEQKSTAKQVFLDKMKAIAAQTGGASMKKIQDLKDSFAKQAEKISSPAVSTDNSEVGEKKLIDALDYINNKTLTESNIRQEGIKESKTNMPGGGKSKKRLRGGKSKKRRKRTYKRR